MVKQGVADASPIKIGIDTTKSTRPFEQARNLNVSPPFVVQPDKENPQRKKTFLWYELQFFMAPIVASQFVHRSGFMASGTCLKQALLP